MLQVRRNVAMSVSDAVNESICINTILLLVTAGKILIYFSLILGKESSCKFSLNLWLFFMFIHDVYFYH